MCFSMFVSASRWLAEIWQLSRRGVGEPQGNWRWNWRWNSNSRGVVESSPSFSRPAARAPRRACSQATRGKVNTTELGYTYMLPGALTAKYCYGFSSFTFYKSQISGTAEPRDGFHGFSSFFKTLYQRNFSVPTNTWTLIKPLRIRGWRATRKIWTFLKLIHMSVEVNTWLVGSEVWVF